MKGADVMREDVRAVRFAGRVAMVTGAASGIGAAVAEELPAPSFW